DTRRACRGRRVPAGAGSLWRSRVGSEVDEERQVGDQVEVEGGRLAADAQVEERAVALEGERIGHPRLDARSHEEAHAEVLLVAVPPRQELQSGLEQAGGGTRGDEVQLDAAADRIEGGRIRAVLDTVEEGEVAVGGELLADGVAEVEADHRRGLADACDIKVRAERRQPVEGVKLRPDAQLA